MNEMQVFNSPEFGKIRMLLIDNEPWAIGNDIAAALGYQDVSDALKTYVDDDDRKMSDTLIPGGEDKQIIVNESGIYTLILSSTLPGARRFKRWMTSSILPTLRGTGDAIIPETFPRVLTPDDYLTAARILSSCRNERLPYVIPLLKKAGIELDERQKPSNGNGKDPVTARLLCAALNDYGVSISALERLTGINNVQLYRMRNGTSRYNEARAATIRDAIHALCPELDIDTLTVEIA